MAKSSTILFTSPFPRPEVPGITPRETPAPEPGFGSAVGDPRSGQGPYSPPLTQSASQRQTENKPTLVLAFLLFIHVNLVLETSNLVRHQTSNRIQQVKAGKKARDSKPYRLLISHLKSRLRFGGRGGDWPKSTGQPPGAQAVCQLEGQQQWTHMPSLSGSLLLTETLRVGLTPHHVPGEDSKPQVQSLA